MEQSDVLLTAKPVNNQPQRTTRSKSKHLPMNPPPSKESQRIVVKDRLASGSGSKNQQTKSEDPPPSTESQRIVVKD
jgi:hypothetical protein